MALRDHVEHARHDADGHVRRDVEGKATVPLAGLPAHVIEQLEAMQSDMLETARTRRDDSTADVTSVAEAIEAARTGFARIRWGLLDDDGLTALKAEAISVRCLQDPDGDVATSDDDPESVATVARAY